jgi:DNA-binding SARP family transcriptional activator
MDGASSTRDNGSLLEFRLLGPLEAVDNGESVPLGGRQQRALLAALLLRRGEVVSADQLIDSLWGERPPATASTIVQLYVSRLRKLLGRDVLLTRAAGYELDVASHQIDAGRFEALLATAAETDGPAETARVLRQALALWRGPALGDFAYDGFAAAESGRLEDLRLVALEDRIDADLLLGRHAELVPEVEALLVGQRLRERLRGQLMLALYRSGRQADALAIYREGRRVLVEELGLEPRAELRELERRILDQDPALDAAPGHPSTAAGREERKVVTALFADLAGFGETALDAEEVQALLDPVRGGVRTELVRFGGSVETLVGGTIAAVFGAPSAHEDDPERGVRAALACRAVVAEAAAADSGLSLELRVGLDTGEVLVGRDGQVVGEPMSTADRLRATAVANAVLVTDTTRTATAHAIEYEPGESLAARGSGRRIGVWQAVAPAAPIRAERPRARSVPIVGRDAELGLLRERIQSLESGSGATSLTLVGAPGAGKSRVLREAASGAAGVRWLQGRSIPYGDGVAYWSFAEIVKTVAGILDTDAPAQAGAKLRRAVREAVAEDADFVEQQLRVLLGIDPRDLSSGRFAAFTAWHVFLAGLAAARPLVVVFEDIHWADDGLLDFVEHLQTAATSAPLLVLCTARPELLERRPGWAPLVELAPLSDGETRGLLAGLLGVASLPDELEAVVARVGGNCLFAEEYARAIADAQAGELLLPDTVHQVIAARLDALAPATKVVLQDAAVVGEVFWPGALVALGGLDAASCQAQLDELTRRDLVTYEPRSVVGDELQYAFKHVLIRDVAYAGIPRAQRAAKHRQTAEWIEARSRDDDVAELVAHHCGIALELARTARLEIEALVEQTAEALWRAGERARQLYANAEAADYFRRALMLLDEAVWADDEWSAELTAAANESLGDVLELSRGYDEGVAAFARAAELVPKRDRIRSARLLRKQAYSRKLQCRFDEAVTTYDAALAALGNRSSGAAWWEERCEIESSRANAISMSTRWSVEAAEESLTALGPLLERHGTASHRGGVSMMKGCASALRERFVASEPTLEYFRVAADLADEAGDLRVACTCHFMLGFHLLWSWHLDEADAELTEALALCERTGDLIDRTSSLTYLTLVQRRRCDLAATRRLVERALEAAEITDVEVPEALLHAQANMAWIAWREGDYARAEELAVEAWAGWGQDLGGNLGIWAWLPAFPLLGLALRAGREDEARDLAELLLDPARQALPDEIEEALRSGRLADAAELAVGYGYL